MAIKRAIDRLAQAYKRGTGMRLDADDVIDLVEGDTAIQDAVTLILLEEQKDAD